MWIWSLSVTFCREGWHKFTHIPEERIPSAIRTFLSDYTASYPREGRSLHIHLCQNHRTSNLSIKLCYLMLLKGKYHRIICSNWHRKGVDEQLHSFSTNSAPCVVGGQCHVPTAILPGVCPGTHCRGGWVALRVGWVWRIRILLLLPSVRSPDIRALSQSVCSCYIVKNN